MSGEEHSTVRPTGSFNCPLCDVVEGTHAGAEKHAKSFRHRVAFAKVFQTDNHIRADRIYLKRQSLISSAFSHCAMVPKDAYFSPLEGFTRVCAMKYHAQPLEATVSVEIFAPSSLFFHGKPRPHLKYDNVPHGIYHSTDSLISKQSQKPMELIVRTAAEFLGQLPADLLLGRLEPKMLGKTRVENIAIAKAKMNKNPGVELRLRLQTIQNLDPAEILIQVLEDDLEKSLHRQETVVAFDSKYVGIDLCLWEMQVWLRSNAHVCGTSVCFPLYLECTHPKLIQLREILTNIAVPADSVGFLPSTREMGPGNDEVGPQTEMRLEKKSFKDYGSSLATEVSRQYLTFNHFTDTEKSHHGPDQRQTSMRPKTKDDYIVREHFWSFNQDQPGNSIISLPANQVLAPRKFSPQSALAMVIRDLSVSIYAKDMMEHIQLRNPVVSRVNNSETGDDSTECEILPPQKSARLDFGLGAELEKAMAITVSADDSTHLKVSSKFNPRLGLFTETAESIIEKGSVPFQHFMANVQGMRKDDEKIIFYALVDKSVPVELIKTVTILPDHRVLSSALKSMQLVDWDEQKVIGQINLNNVVKQMESKGADSMVIGNEENDESEISSLSTKINTKIREGLFRINRALWSAAPFPIGYSQFSEEAVRDSLIGLEINQRQTDFVRLVAGTDNSILVLYGPPGTGKTTTIASAIIALDQYTSKIHSGLQILMVAPTNPSADAIALAILERLEALGVDIEKQTALKRLYASSYDMHLVRSELKGCSESFGTDKEIMEEIAGEPVGRSLLLSILHETPIIVTTIDSAVLRLQTLQEHCNFQLVAIDEAGRVPICLSYPLMSLAPRVLLSGDPKQMKPFFPQQLHFLSHLHLDVSILQFAIDIGNCYIQLVKNFRSVRDIIKPSNENIYFRDPMEASMHDVHQNRFDYLYDKYPFLKEYFSGSGVQVVPVSGMEEHLPSGPSYSNLAEAFYITKFLCQAYQSGLTKEASIGLVSFYNAQLTVIEKLVRELQKDGLLGETDSWLLMLSSDRFQGLASDFILLSGTRAKPDVNYDVMLRRILGFVGQMERDNVGFTRAKMGLLAFIRAANFVQNPYWASAIELSLPPHGSFSNATSNCAHLHELFYKEGRQGKVSLRLDVPNNKLLPRPAIEKPKPTPKPTPIEQVVESAPATNWEEWKAQKQTPTNDIQAITVQHHLCTITKVTLSNATLQSMHTIIAN